MSETEVKYHQPADDSWPPWEAAARPPGLQPAPVRVPVGSGMGGRCSMKQRESGDAVERDGDE